MYQDKIFQLEQRNTGL